MLIFLGVLGILVFSLLVVACVILWNIYKKEFRLSEKTTYLGGMSKFAPEDDCTTVIPMPLNAATCDHDWDVVSDDILEMHHQLKKVVILSCRKCGMVDKTVTATDKCPPKQPDPCQHDWETTKDERLEMPHEQKMIFVMTCKKCGDVNTIKETTSKTPESIPLRSECHHKWVVDKKVTMDSAYEQMLKSISTSNYGRKKIDPEKKLGIDYNNAPSWMFRKSYLVQRVCQKCGEVHAIIASNFDLDGVVSSEENISEDVIKIKEGLN